jgi:hypothetical protein
MVFCLATVFEDLPKWRSVLPNIVQRLFRIQSHLVPNNSASKSPAIRRWLKFILLLMLAAGITTQWWSKTSYSPMFTVDFFLLGLSLFLVFLNIQLWIFLSSRIRYFPFLGWCIAIIASFGLAMAGDYLSDHWHRGYVKHYDRMSTSGLISNLVRFIPPATRICILDSRPYPFFGSKREYRISQPTRFSTYEQWERYLRERQVEWIVVRFDSSEDRIGWNRILGWLRDRPEVFTPYDSEMDAWPYNVFRFNANSGFVMVYPPG